MPKQWQTSLGLQLHAYELAQIIYIAALCIFWKKI